MEQSSCRRRGAVFWKERQGARTGEPPRGSLSLARWARRKSSCLQERLGTAARAGRPPAAAEKECSPVPGTFVPSSLQSVHLGKGNCDLSALSQSDRGKLEIEWTWVQLGACVARFSGAWKCGRVKVFSSFRFKQKPCSCIHQLWYRYRIPLQILFIKRSALLFKNLSQTQIGVYVHLCGCCFNSSSSWITHCKWQHQRVFIIECLFAQIFHGSACIYSIKLLC